MIFSLSNDRLKKIIILNFIFMQPLSQQTLISDDILLSHITHFSPHVLHIYFIVYSTLFIVMDLDPH